MADNIKEIAFIEVDDGTVEVPIRNKRGEQVGKFYFRPTDVGIINRYNEMVSKFDEITKPLESININPDGTADEADQTQVDALNEATRRLYEVCDYMFGGNMSEAFFGSMNPFSPVSGAFYCEHAIAGVGNFISAQMEAET